MIQQKLKLSLELKHILMDCDEIFVGVALISDKGFKFIQDHISKAAKQNYLVGIGLSTSPKVLSELKAREGSELFKSKIYHKLNELFHPKVYIIKKGNKLTAIVGSSNCTDGGFDIKFRVKRKD